MKEARVTSPDDWVISGLRWLLGLVFIASALGKIADPARFADDVAAYRLLPLYTVNLFAITLPWVELLCGLSLINRVATRSSALLICCLTLMFIVGSVSAITRGLDIECGCMTLARTKVGWGLVVRGAIFLAMALAVLLRHEER